MSLHKPGWYKTNQAQIRGLCVFTMAALVAFINMPYGLDAPEPIGAYLNGTFPTVSPEGSTGIPQLLSETGAFGNLEIMEPAPGFIPYNLRQPFWSDGAEKYRWIAIPNDGAHDTPAEQIEFSEEGNCTFFQTLSTKMPSQHI